MFALLLFVARFFFVRKGGKQYPIKESYIQRIISNERCIIAIEGYFVNPLLGLSKEVLVKRIPFNTILLKSLLPNNPPTNIFQQFSHDSAKSNIQENCSTLHPNVTTHDKTADCCPFWQLSTGANASSAINVRHVLTSFFANSSKVGRIWPEEPSTVSYTVRSSQIQLSRRESVLPVALEKVVKKWARLFFEAGKWFTIFIKFRNHQPKAGRRARGKTFLKWL